ncbi:acetamidase [Bacillus salipaludis]|uniref:Acetamidase n=1 Tax=Bacillus salipaludis TaxID=2547811 RepID=A0A4R5VIS7_9BACI|nr:acetamidase/formamidase family protein [Bacillus salipaludis]MDQ6600636.1 acetamidase/formamidase family protein [Bacillus salipaludis]TDK55426.1 acetamidase [Bacillus salipaludis]
MRQTIKGKYVYEFSSANKPIASVKLGEIVDIETIDCYGGHLKTEKDLITDFPHLKVNPATGPIYIEDVKRGDVLEIIIKKIELDSAGVMSTRPGGGLLGDYIREAQTRILKIENDMVILNNTMTFPVNKMIGVIGVAPLNEAIPTSTPGEHGGNMDTKDITEGNTLYLPVFQTGALLALGDLHASMGDGELNGTGVEIGGKVTLQINKKENVELFTPIVETDSHILIIKSATEFRTAVREAMIEGIRLLQKEHNLEFADAYRMISAKGDIRVSQLVNPKITVRLMLPKCLVSI